jgi:branched-subunit amino acid ABC-type transport system permease component
LHVLVQSAIDGLLFGAIYAIAGASFGLIYNVTKVFHIAFGSIGTLGVYVAVSLAGNASSFGVITSTVFVGMLVGMLTTIAVVALVYQPLTNRAANSGSTFVSSLAVALVIQAVVVLIFGADNRSFAIDSFVLRHNIGGFGISEFHVVTIALAVVVVAGLNAFINRTRFGQQIRALAANREQAELVGIRSRLVVSVACGAAGLLSVIAFVLLGMNGAVVATGGTQLTLFAVLATIAGGSGSIVGTALVGAGLGLLGGISGAAVPGEWSTTVVFVCAVVLILFRPQGISAPTAKRAAAA